MIAKQKKALREHYRQVRDALLPDERLAQSQEICTRIMQTELYAQAQSVLLYAAQGSEIDLSTLARDAWEKGKTVAYPRCLDGQGHMAFYTVDAPERLVPGKFSIPEPDEHCPQWQAKGNVLCIVPALAVDAHGHRGNELCDDYEDTEGAVPGKQAQCHKHGTEQDLENNIAFALLVAAPVYGIGKTAGQIDTHSGIAAQKQIVDRGQEGIGDLAKHDVVIFFLLHSDHDKRRAHKANDLGQ